MESEINTSINSLEISDEIKLRIKEIISLLSDKSLENILICRLPEIYELEEIFKKYSLKNLLEKLKKTYSTDIILVLKAAGNLDISDELNKEIENKNSLNIALMLAARNGNEKNVELLLENEVNKVNLNNILITEAINGGNKEVLKIILEKLKEELLIQEIIKHLLAAIKKNNKEIVEQIINFSKCLLEKTKPSNQVFEEYLYYHTILQSAVETNNEEITGLIIDFLKYLSEKGILTNEEIFLNVSCKKYLPFKTPLLLAVKINNKKIAEQIINFLKKLLEEKKLSKNDIFEVLNKRNIFNDTFFSLSIKNNNKDFVEQIVNFLKYLLENKILSKEEILEILNVKEEKSYSNNPLFKITKNKEAVEPIMNFLKYLLENKILSKKEFLEILNKEIKIYKYNNNKKYYYNFSNCTPLGYAILKNNEEVVQQIIVLLKNNLLEEEFLKILNAEIKYTSNNSINPSTILMLAFQKGNGNIINILFENVADPTIQDKYGNTPLMLAAQNGNVKILKALMDKIRGNLSEEINKKNKEGYTALMLAAQNDNENIINILLENEADPNIQNEEGYTALMLAAQNGNVKILETLMAKIRGDLLEQINKKNKKGYTALTLAVKNGNKNNIVNILLENKADPNIQDKYGNTPIFYAKSSDNTEIIELLKQYDVDDIEYNLEKLLLESFFDYSLNKKIGDSELIQYNPTDEEKRVFQIIRLQNLFFMAQALNDDELLYFFETKGITEDKVKDNLFSGSDTSDFQEKDCFRKFINFTDTKEKEREVITLNQKLIEEHLKRIIPIILSKISDYQINRFQERLVPFIDKLKIEGFDGGDSIKYIIKSAISTLFDVNSTIDQKWDAKEFLAKNLKLFKKFYKKVFEKKDDSITNGYLMLSSICSAKSKDELVNALFSIVRYKMQLMYSKEEFKYETIFVGTPISIGDELNPTKNQIYKKVPNDTTKSSKEKQKLIKKLDDVKFNNGIVTYRGIQQKTKQKESSKNLLTNYNSTFGRPEIGLWDQNILNELYYKVSKKSSFIGPLISTSILSYHSYFFAGIRNYTEHKNYVFSIYFVPKEDLEKIYRTDELGEVAMSNLPLDYRIFNIVSDKDGEISLDFSPVAESMCFKYNKTELIQFFETFKTMFNKLILEEQQEIMKNLTDEQQDQLEQLLIQLFAKNEEKKELETKTLNELLESFKTQSIESAEEEKKEQEFIHLTKQQLEVIISLSNKIFIEEEISNVDYAGTYNMPLWTDFLQNLQMERTLDLLQKETEQLKIGKKELEEVKEQLEVKQQSQKTFVIPDIHGSLECFLQDLINIGAIDVIKDLYIYFQKDSNQHVNLNRPLFTKPSDYEENSSNYVKLPLFVIKKEFLESNSKIVQVGDLVDRGENSTECLVLSSLLSKQLCQNYTTIIGNHELAKLQGLYYDENDTQKQLIADMIKSGNMLCMQHIPGSNNIYSHVPLFKKNISYFISRLFGIEPFDEYKGNNTESYDEKDLQKAYGKFSQQHQEELFRLSIVSKLLEKLEKGKTTLTDIKGILDAKIDRTEKNQIISEIAKELKLSENKEEKKEENKEKNKEKIEVLQKCLENLKSKIEQQKENSFDYILDVFVNTSNKLVKDFVGTFIHGNTKEESEKEAEELHLHFLLTSIISETFFGQIKRKKCPVTPYISGSLKYKNLEARKPQDLSTETYQSLVNVCGHDSFPYYSSLDGESKREGYGTADYLNDCGILWTDEQQRETEERKHACYYEIEKQQNGKIIYNAHRTEHDITLEQIKTIPYSETYKITTKEELVKSKKDSEFSCIQFSAPKSIQTNTEKENSIPNTISFKKEQISSKGKEDENGIVLGM